MSIPAKVTNYLSKQKVKYEIVPHRTVFTVYDLAQTLKTKLNTVAKTLLVKADKEYRLIIVPATHRLDIAAVKKLLGAKSVSLASEKDMTTKFKVKPGAMTAFGKMHKVAVVVDKSLLRAEKLLFGAGSFTESLRLKVKDYIKAEEPTVGPVAKKA